ncbi:hypothetical protein MBLNU230_g5144t1 [Neophaeotheca triangularis]
MRRVFGIGKRHASQVLPLVVRTPEYRITPAIATCRREIATTTSKVELRPYQKDSINAVLKYLKDGKRRLGLSLATGSGKTVIFSHLLERIQPPTPHATQTLILAHRRELVEQAAKHCRNLYPEKLVEIEMGAQHASGAADVTVASVQSIMSGERLYKYDSARFKLVVVDEAHHITGQQYMGVLQHFGLAESRKENRIALVGVSATFSRNDGVTLGKAIDYIVYHKDYVDMIVDNYLANAIFTTVNSQADLSKVKEASGEFVTRSLSLAVNNPQSNAILVRSWLAKAKDRQSTMVFCVDIAHVEALTAAFRAHGIDAKNVTTRTRVKERRQLIEDFKAGVYPVLLNCGIFTEGTDVPNIDCIILARPTQSRNLLVQMLGRGLRKSAGKENCHVLDMVSSLETGIMTTPTLFGLDPDEIVNNANTDDLAKLKKERDLEREVKEDESIDPPGFQTDDISSFNVSFTDYENVHDLIEDTSGERYIRAISPFAWVHIDDNRFILSDNSSGFLTLKHVVTNGVKDHIVILTQKLPAIAGSKSPYARPRQIASSLSFEGAVRAADTYAKEHFTFIFIHKNARWRRREATEGQLKFLNAKRKQEDKLEAHMVTKGKATDWITKVKHGAQGRFNRMASDRKKIEKMAEKRQVLSRQRVEVGPVNEPSRIGGGRKVSRLGHS